jgi:hypothetical protein
MAQLTDLSNDLLLLIVSYFATGDDSITLLNQRLPYLAFVPRHCATGLYRYTCVQIAEPTTDPLKCLE